MLVPIYQQQSEIDTNVGGPGSYGLLRNLAPVHPVSPFKPWRNTHSAENSLLILTVAFGALSLVPQFRWAGSIATRSITFITATASSVYGGSDQTAGSHLKGCIKIMAVTLGIIGVAAFNSNFIVVSLFMDTSLHVFEAAKSKKLADISVGVIDAFAMAAVVTDSASFILAASIISTLAIGIIAVRKFKGAKNRGDILEGTCYSALTLLSLASSVAALEIKKQTPTKAHFTFTNKKHRDLKVLKSGENKFSLLVKPGETIKAEVPYDKTYWRFKEVPSLLACLGLECFWQPADHIEYKTTVLKQGLAIREIFTLPIGGTVILTNEIS